MPEYMHVFWYMGMSVVCLILVVRFWLMCQPLLPPEVEIRQHHTFSSASTLNLAMHEWTYSYYLHTNLDKFM